MKLGLELNHGFMREGETLESAFTRAKQLGAQGAQLKSPLYISKTLDRGKLVEAKKTADALGMYLVCGLGRINPYNTCDAEDIWMLGRGSYKAACEKIIAAGALIDSRHLISQTGGWRGSLPHPYTTDRFRQDVPWAQQLEATGAFLASLAPVLKHYGCSISIETHEEITSHEVLRLIESLPPGTATATLDTGNLVLRGEDPVAAARRLAPHIRHLHAKDVLLLPLPQKNGLWRHVRPAGEGVLDFAAIAHAVYAHSPHALWHVEDHNGDAPIDYNDTIWVANHPDLCAAELTELERLAEKSRQKIAAGAPPPESYVQAPFTDACERRAHSALRHLANVLRDFQ